MTEYSKAKHQVAQEALSYVKNDAVVGVGTGSTVNALIELLPQIASRCTAFVASSKETEKRLKEKGLLVDSPNQHNYVDVYLDGADECDPHGRLIKGGGGAMTGERVIANMAKQFICMIDKSKCVKTLGKFPVAVEVLSMARSQVARSLLAMGGDPVYREGAKTDHGNDILDVYGLPLTDPVLVADTIDRLIGVVGHGLFVNLKPSIVLLGYDDHAERYL